MARLGRSYAARVILLMPVVEAATGATVTPDTVAAVAGVPTATVSGTALFVPTAVTAMAGVGTSTPQAGSAPASAVVAAVAGVGSVTVVTVSAPTPAAVAATAGVGTTVPAAGSRPVPTVVAATAGVGTAVPAAGSRPVPAVVAGVAGVGSVTLAASAAATPAAVAATAGVGTTVPSAGSRPVPTVVAGAAGVGSVTVVTVNVPTPAAVAALAGVGTTVPAAGSRPVPTVVAGAAGVGSVTVTTVNVPTPAAVVATASVGLVVVRTTQITARTATVVETASATTITGTLPTGLADGDVMIATFACVDVPANFTGPGGSWAALFTPRAMGPSRTFAAYYKSVTNAAGETGPVVSWVAAGRGTVIVGAWTGVDPVTPIDAAAATVVTGGGTTHTVPSITTLTDNALLVGAGGVATSSATTIAKPAEMTQLAVTTGTGVRTMLADEARPTAGATGTRAWTTSTSLPTVAYSVALRDAAFALPATLTYSWVGVPTSTGLTVSTRTADTLSVRLKIGTDAALTTGVVFGAAVTPDADGWAKCVSPTLTPGTTYYYAVEMTGGAATVLSTVYGPVKTLPTPGQPWSGRIAASSCLDTSATVAFTNMLARSPDLFFHTGDFHYGDNTSASQASHQDDLEAALAANSGLRSVLANVPTLYVKSDHDSGGGNGALPGVWTAPNRAAHLLVVPQLPQVDPNSLYHSFVLGRVRVIVTDDRYQRTSTEFLDAAQETWFKAQMAQPEPVKLWVQQGPWNVDGVAPSGGDKWNDYPTQYAALSAWIAGNAVGKIVTIHGDIHSLGLDDGTNSPAGVVTFGASPLGNEATIYGGPFSHGTYPPGGGVVSQYGLIDFADNGTTITITFSGRDTSDVERLSLSIDVTAAAPAVVAAVASVGSPQLATGSSPGPGVVPAVASVGAVTVLRTGQATPAVVAAVAGVGVVGAVGSGFDPVVLPVRFGGFVDRVTRVGVQLAAVDRVTRVGGQLAAVDRVTRLRMGL
jgi:hypothetical protein